MSGFHESYLTLFPHLCSLLPLLYQLWIGWSRHRPTLLAFVILLATAVCVPSLNHVANFSIVPDSVEYASSARNLLFSGSPFISIGEASYPSRYPFGFSLFVVLPGILAGNFTSGAEILFVTLYSVIGIVCSYTLGNKLAGPLAGVLSVTLLLLLPSYVLSSQELLTYSPSAGLGLLFLFFCYRLYEQPHSRFLTVGLSASLLLAVACRPLSVFLALPVIVWSSIHNRNRLLSIFLSLVPTVLLLASYLTFNYNFFSSPFRSGYSFWSSIPYDFPGLLLNVSYLSSNIGTCITTLGLIVLLGAFSVRYYISNPLNDLLVYSLALFGLPLTIFHLFYFFPGSFFFLQAGILAVPIVGAMLSRMIPPHLSSKSLPSALVLLLLVGCLQRFSVYQRLNTPRTRTELVNEVSSTLPPDSILISGIDPVSFSLLSNGRSTITIIPKSRRVEYASKFVVPVRPEGVSVDGVSALHHRNEILRTSGAEEVIAITALEDMPTLAKTMKKGVPVYFETVTKDELTIEALRGHFTVTKVTEHLYRILPGSEKMKGSTIGTVTQTVEDGS